MLSKKTSLLGFPYLESGLGRHKRRFRCVELGGGGMCRRHGWLWFLGGSSMMSFESICVCTGDLMPASPCPFGSNSFQRVNKPGSGLTCASEHITLGKWWHQSIGSYKICFCPGVCIYFISHVLGTHTQGQGSLEGTTHRHLVLPHFTREDRQQNIDCKGCPLVVSFPSYFFWFSRRLPLKQ